MTQETSDPLPDDAGEAAVRAPIPPAPQWVERGATILPRLSKGMSKGQAWRIRLGQALLLVIAVALTDAFIRWCATVAPSQGDPRDWSAAYTDPVTIGPLVMIVAFWFAIAELSGRISRFTASRASRGANQDAAG